MLCDDESPPCTPEAAPTPSACPSSSVAADSAQDAAAALRTDVMPATKTKKTKKTKKKSFSDLMAEMTQSEPVSPGQALELHRQKIARHLGGGTFAKLDKV